MWSSETAKKCSKCKLLIDIQQGKDKEPMYFQDRTYGLVYCAECLLKDRFGGCFSPQDCGGTDIFAWFWEALLTSREVVKQITLKFRKENRAVFWAEQAQRGLKLYRC
jgi:hypothetical protein